MLQSGSTRWAEQDSGVAPSAARVLLIDDDELGTRALIRSLDRRLQNVTFHHVASAKKIPEIFDSLSPELAIVDLALDNAHDPTSGLELVSELIQRDPTMRIFVLTGHGEEQFGIESLSRGASSFLTKPIDPGHLAHLILDAIETCNLKRKYARLLKTASASHSLKGIVSASAAMARCLDKIHLASTHPQPVLLVGETGTGKSLFARALHEESRAKKPFIRFLPQFGSHDLVSSELFGHQRGAFTGAHEPRRGLLEEVAGGTLFIDEVDELSKETQVTLLHVLQEKTFRRLGSNRDCSTDFRLLTASNRTLEELKNGKILRSDFFHRIAQFVIEIPPLRDRPEDIQLLAEDFLQTLTMREKIPVQGISPEAAAMLRTEKWPGNVRELQATVEGAVYRARFSGSRFIEPAHLEFQKSKQRNRSGTFRSQVQDFEVNLIRTALQECRNNQSEAARKLGLERSSLRRILARASNWKERR